MILRQEDNIEVIGEASHGQMAVELAQELHPDVVIMDVRMPVLNGIEATRLIKSDHPDTKVIGFTLASKLISSMRCKKPELSRALARVIPSTFC